MFQDILRESPIYQEIVEQGREEERQQELQRQRQTLMSFVQRHFPEISALAKLQVDSVADPEFLQTVILKLLDCQTIEEARQLLLNISKGETKH
jgi:predicted transposase YdaD